MPAQFKPKVITEYQTSEISVTPFALANVPEDKPVSTSSANTVIRKKFELCKNFREKGVCKYGDKCLFAHGEHELTRRSTPSEDKKSEEKVAEETLPVVQDQTTLDSTKIVNDTLQRSLELGEKLSPLLENNTSDLTKKRSSGSEHYSNEATINDDPCEEENSTTLSSIYDSTKTTPEKQCIKLQSSSSVQMHSKSND